MQMTVESWMAGEHPYYSFHPFEIFVDGVLHNSVIELDTLGTLDRAGGYIVKYKQGSDGHLITNYGELETEVVYGNVEIKLK